MYLQNLNKKRPNCIKQLACNYLAKRYNKPVEFFLSNTEEKEFIDKYYYIRTDEEGKELGIVYLFTDFKFACNKEANSEPFDEEWIKLVLEKLDTNSPYYASKYISSLDRQMSREVERVKEERVAQIEMEYEKQLLEIKTRRDEELGKLRQDVKKLETSYDDLFHKIAFKSASKSQNNNLN